MLRVLMPRVPLIVAANYVEDYAKSVSATIKPLISVDPKIGAVVRVNEKIIRGEFSTVKPFIDQQISKPSLDTNASYDAQKKLYRIQVNYANLVGVEELREPEEPRHSKIYMKWQTIRANDVSLGKNFEDIEDAISSK